MFLKVFIPGKTTSTGRVLETINQERNVSLEKKNAQSSDYGYRMC